MGRPLVRLPDAPMDSPDFLAAWAAAMKASTGHEPRPGKGGQRIRQAGAWGLRLGGGRKA